MEDLLRFLETYEIWIYVLLGTASLIPLRRLLIAWHEWRSAIFGLERERAQREFSSAMTFLMLLILIGLAQFFLVSFIAPGMPRTNIIATPTIDRLATPEKTQAVTNTPLTTPTGLIPTLAVASEGCVPGQIEWTFPKNNDQIKGTVTLTGTVNVPNLGFYKYEYSSAGTDNWITIAAGDSTIIDKPLGTSEKSLGTSGQWNTSQLAQGDYRLRLVVVDNQDKTLPACVINIRITSP